MPDNELDSRTYSEIIGKSGVIENWEWKPSQDFNHVLVLIDRMIYLGYYPNVRWYARDFIMVKFLHNGKELARFKGKHLCRTVCEAALLAIKVTDKKNPVLKDSK